MKLLNKTVKILALTSAVLSATGTFAVSEQGENTSKLLTANFESRKIVKIEAGDFHFLPGQIAPVHTHVAPAIGYVSKGQILYQVEGQKPQLLNEGDAFYEPAGPRILRFDNASATEEAIFIDFNLQQEGEPFIVFEQALTEKIDRRTLPTLKLKDSSIEQVDVFVSELEPNGSKQIEPQDVALFYIAQGSVNVMNEDNESVHLQAGDTFSLSSAQSSIYFENASSEEPAKLVGFHLL